MPLDKEIEGDIVNLLKDSPMGASSTEIAQKLSASRPTLIKYLGIMKVQGIVDYKKVGMAKVWFLPREVEYSDLLGEKDIISVLKRDEDTGYITLFGRPRTIIPTRFVYQLCVMMSKQQQEEIFRRITLNRINEYENATDIKLDESSPKEKEEFIRLWVNYRMNTGWGKLKELRLDHKKRTLTVTLEHSVVADGYKKYSDEPAKSSVCNLLNGIFLGFMEGAFGKTGFVAKEVKCIAINGGVCQFKVEPKK